MSVQIFSSTGGVTRTSGVAGDFTGDRVRGESAGCTPSDRGGGAHSGKSIGTSYRGVRDQDLCGPG
jgi:hypothetical protein